jgi:pSer/pThr/pTyr-binding forkhead associated (FHA) protein
MGLAEKAELDESTAVGKERRQGPFGAPHVFVLAVIGGKETARSHRIISTETVIGRDRDAHFVIDDEQISKMHCRIRVDGGVATIIDLGSRNGTSVNGRRLNPEVAQRLRHLDEIEIGKHRLFLLAGRYRDKPKNRAV